MPEFPEFLRISPNAYPNVPWISCFFPLNTLGLGVSLSAKEIRSFPVRAARPNGVVYFRAPQNLRGVPKKAPGALFAAPEGDFR